MNEIEITEIKRFNYEQLDATTASILINTENVMRETLGTTYTKIGQELRNSKELLSKNGYGCFEEWYTSLGFKKNKVYDLISRYDLIVGNSDKQAMIEELPLSLSYEISKPSANNELKEKVLVGDITTLKEYKDLEKANKELEQKIQDLENKEPIVKEVPTVPEDYEYLKSQKNNFENQIRNLKRSIEDKDFELQKATNEKEILARKAKLNEEEAKKFNEMKQQIDFLYKEKADLSRQIASATELSALAVRIDNMLKTELSPIRYSRVFERMDSEVARENLLDIIHKVDQWSFDIKKMIPEKYRKVEVYHE